MKWKTLGSGNQVKGTTETRTLKHAFSRTFKAAHLAGCLSEMRLIVIQHSKSGVTRLSSFEPSQSHRGPGYTEVYDVTQMQCQSLECRSVSANGTEVRHRCSRVLLIIERNRTFVQFWRSTENEHGGMEGSSLSNRQLESQSVLGEGVTHVVLASQTRPLVDHDDFCFDHLDLGRKCEIEELLGALNLASAHVLWRRMKEQDLYFLRGQSCPGSQKEWTWKAQSKMTTKTSSRFMGNKSRYRDPKRPRGFVTAFNFFAQEERERVVADFPFLADCPNQINRIVGQRWRKLPAMGRARFETKAEQDFHRFSTEYSRYTPEAGVRKYAPNVAIPGAKERLQPHLGSLRREEGVIKVEEFQRLIEHPAAGSPGEAVVLPEATAMTPGDVQQHVFALQSVVLSGYQEKDFSRIIRDSAEFLLRAEGHFGLISDDAAKGGVVSVIKLRKQATPSEEDSAQPRDVPTLQTE
eukprot:scaffold4732_cov162-Pinguiococcus_pyrenoidosus.AAC.1